MEENIKKNENSIEKVKNIVIIIGIIVISLCSIVGVIKYVKPKRIISATPIMVKLEVNYNNNGTRQASIKTETDVYTEYSYELGSNVSYTVIFIVDNKLNVDVTRGKEYVKVLSVNLRYVENN